MVQPSLLQLKSLTLLSVWDFHVAKSPSIALLLFVIFSWKLSIRLNWPFNSMILLLLL